MRFAAAITLAAGLLAAAGTARASSDACIDSLDAVLGTTYVSAADSTHGPRDLPTACVLDPRRSWTYTFTWACQGDSMDVTLVPRATVELRRRQFIRLPAGVQDPSAVNPRWRHYQHDRVAISQDLSLIHI